MNMTGPYYFTIKLSSSLDSNIDLTLIKFVSLAGLLSSYSRKNLSSFLFSFFLATLFMYEGFDSNLRIMAVKHFH